MSDTAASDEATNGLRRLLTWKRGILAGVVALFIVGAWHSWDLRTERLGLLREIERVIFDEVTRFQTEPQPAINAAPRYEEAKALIDLGHGRHALLMKLDRDWEEPPADLVAFLDDSAQGLLCVEQGAEAPECLFVTDFGIRTQRGRPWLGGAPSNPVQVWELGCYADLLLVRVRLAIRNGDSMGAAKDLVRCARVLRHAVFQAANATFQVDGHYMRRLGDALATVLVDPSLTPDAASLVASGLPDWREMYAGQTSSRRITRLTQLMELWHILNGQLGRNEDRIRASRGLSVKPRFNAIVEPYTREDLALIRALHESLVKSLAELQKRDGCLSERPLPYAGRVEILRRAFAVRAHELSAGEPPASLGRLEGDLAPDPFGNGSLVYRLSESDWMLASQERVTVHSRIPGDTQFRSAEIPLSLEVRVPRRLR